MGTDMGTVLEYIDKIVQRSNKFSGRGAHDPIFFERVHRLANESRRELEISP